MVTRESTIEQAARHVFPWMNRWQPNQPLKGLGKAAARVTMEGAIRLIPHIPDETLVSIFKQNIKQIPYEEGREFAKQVLLMGKRLLASPQYKKPARELLIRINRIQAGVIERRQAYRAKYGNDPPGFIAISPSMRCNLRCVGCYAGEYSKKDDLGAEVLNRVVKEVKDIGVPFMVIIGGEPLICDEVLEMCEANPDMSFICYTNGTLIDEGMAKRLARMGNVYPAISLEGFEAETDARRGKGTYARILTAMDNLRNAGVPFGFSATVVRTNNELVSSSEFIDFYVKKGCFMGWYFNYIPIGREPDLSLMPSPEQRVSRWHRVKALRRTKPILLGDFWCDGSIVGGCLAAGRSYVHINNKGDVEPCVFAHFAVDNVKDKPLAEILQSPFFRKIRSKQPFSPNMLRPCMIIDNPEVLREAVTVCGARPTHLGAETIIGQLAPKIDSYARSYAEVADPAWQDVHIEDKP